ALPRRPCERAAQDRRRPGRARGREQGHRVAVHREPAQGRPEIPRPSLRHASADRGAHQAARSDGMRWQLAAGVAALAVIVAVALGLTVGRIARPSPTPIRVTVTASPSASPTPVDEATLFKQPVSSGCATHESVWLVTNGGGILRYD